MHYGLLILNLFKFLIHIVGHGNDLRRVLRGRKELHIFQVIKKEATKLGPDQRGEICIQTPAFMKCYLDNKTVRDAHALCTLHFAPSPQHFASVSDGRTSLFK